MNGTTSPPARGTAGERAEALTVLVLGVGSNVSQGILKSLALSALPTRVIAADVTPFAVGLYRADRAYVSPYARDPGFIDWVIDVCERESVAAVMSGVEPVLAALSPAAEHIRARTGSVPIVSPPHVLEVGRDKLLTCRWLAERGLPHPRTADASDAAAVAALVGECGYPLIAKPRRGWGARGVTEVLTEAQLELLAAQSDIVVQEAVGDSGAEYTVGCFCDPDGVLRGSVSMRRELVEGTTVRAEVREFRAAREVSERVVAALRPLGPCNVQLRAGPGGAAVPFELNVRFSGTTPARARLGFNEVEAALRQFVLDEPPRDLPPAREATVLRYWNEMYVPPNLITELEQGHGLRGAGEQRALIEDWGIASQP